MSLNQWLSLADNTENLITGPGVLARFDDEFGRLWDRRPVFLVADGNTLSLIDRTRPGLSRLREPAGMHIFPGEPVLRADYGHVETLIDKLEGFPDAVPVVIGSGTLNDLVKQAAGETGRPYGVIASAASVDGYASDGAALVVNGVKQTLACPAPALILGDTDILSTAPFDMTAAGYADLAAKIPAGADWILADELGEDPIDTTAWEMVQHPLRSWIAEPEQLRGGDPERLSALFEGLNVSGLAMQYLKKSRPASGAEHLMSHIWEMSRYTWQGRTFSHGFKVAVGSLFTMKTVHWLLKRGVSKADFERALSRMPDAANREARIPELFGFLEDRQFLYDVNELKYPSPEVYRNRLELIEQRFDNLQQRWLEYLPSEEDFTAWLREAGCPSSPADLGMTWSGLGETMGLAQYLRHRYTFLDLISDLGLDGELKDYLAEC